MKSIKLESTKKFKHYGNKVKQIGLHPSKPLVLMAHYNGEVSVYNYATQALAKKIEVSSKPLRSAIWAGEDWVVTAGDDLKIRVFNFHTTQRLFEFEGHKDYIRKVVYNPAQQYFLTCADDKTIIRWGISGDKIVQLLSYEEHKHFVMDVKVQSNTEDVFASASLDGTIKLWNINSKVSNCTLKGHRAGINCIEFSKASRPILASGGDDFAVIIWDLSTRTMMQKIDRHEGNVVDLVFMTGLPFLVSIAEDGRINFYNTKNFEFCFELNNFMQKGWSVSAKENLIACGYDEGALVLQIGKNQTLASCGKGKLVWCRNNEVFLANLKALVTKNVRNFERIETESKELGGLEIFPHKIVHNDNAQFFAMVDDSEYLIYKSQTYKQVLYGKCKDFAWGTQNRFAVLDQHNDVSIQSANGTVIATLKFDFYVEAIFGGSFLGVSAGDFILFYDWTGQANLGRIDVEAAAVSWDANTLVVKTLKSFFILRVHPEETEDNIFELLHEIPDTFIGCLFISGLFFYVSESFKLNVVVAGRSFSLANIGLAAQPLEYLDNHERLFFFDSNCQTLSFKISQALIKLLVACNGELSDDDEPLITRALGLADEENATIVKILQSLEKLELAFRVCKNPLQKIDFGIRQGHLDDCLALCEQVREPLAWKKLGDLALSNGRFDIAETAFANCDDLNSLLLIALSTANIELLERVSQTAQEKGNFSVAYAAFLNLSKPDKCLDLLLESNRYGEALIFARTYTPTRIPAVYSAWTSFALSSGNQLLAKKIQRFSANEEDNAVALEVEKLLLEKNIRVPRELLASFNLEYRQLDLNDIYKSQGKDGLERTLDETVSRFAVPEQTEAYTEGRGDDGWEEAEIMEL